MASAGAATSPLPKPIRSAALITGLFLLLATSTQLLLALYGLLARYAQARFCRFCRLLQAPAACAGVPPLPSVAGRSLWPALLCCLPAQPSPHRRRAAVCRLWRCPRCQRCGWWC